RWRPRPSSRGASPALSPGEPRRTTASAAWFEARAIEARAPHHDGHYRSPPSILCGGEMQRAGLRFDLDERPHIHDLGFLCAWLRTGLDRHLPEPFRYSPGSRLDLARPFPDLQGCAADEIADLATPKPPDHGNAHIGAAHPLPSAIRDYALSQLRHVI